MQATNKEAIAQSSLDIHLGHFLQINPNALTVKHHKVNVLQWRCGCWNKMVWNGLQYQLGCSLLWETVSGKDWKRTLLKDQLSHLFMNITCCFKQRWPHQTVTSWLVSFQMINTGNEGYDQSHAGMWDGPYTMSLWAKYWTPSSLIMVLSSSFFPYDVHLIITFYVSETTQELEKEKNWLKAFIQQGTLKQAWTNELG